MQYFDILLIFNLFSIDCPWTTILRSHKGSKFDVDYKDEQLLKIFLRTVILSLWFDYETILLLKGLMFNMRL